MSKTNSGRITSVLFDPETMPENFTPGFNAKAMGLDLDRMRASPVVADIPEGQMATSIYETTNAFTPALDKDATLIARYKRDAENPLICFSLKSNDPDNEIEVFLQDVALKDIARSRMQNIHPAAFIAGYFEGDTIEADQMFYMRLAQTIDRHFTVFIHNEMGKIMATQPENQQQQEPNTPLMH